MARFFQTGVVVTGDPRGGVRAFQLTAQEAERFQRTQERGERVNQRYSRSMDRVSRSQTNATRSLRAFTRLLAGAGIAFGIREIVDLSDTYANLQGRLRVVTDGSEEFNAAQAETSQIAKDTFTALQSTVTLYSRLTTSLSDLGVEEERVFNLTETINQAFAVSGGTAQEASNAIIQLSQGLAAGALRGEEFNSVAEQGERIQQALIRALGVTKGELRELAQEGRLTTQVILEALEGQADAIADDFGELPITVGRSLTNLRTELLELVGGVEEATGASAVLASIILTLAENLDVLLATILIVAGARGLGLLIGTIGQSITLAKQFGVALVALNATSP